MVSSGKRVNARRRTWVVAIAAVVVLASAVAVASRYLDRSSSAVPVVNSTNDIISIGLVADLTGDDGAAGRDLRRGAELWLSHVEQARGIPYNNVDVAAVRFRAADDRGSPKRARALVAAFAKAGVNVVFAPPAQDELTAVIDEASQHGLLTYAPVARPSSVPPTPNATFLSPPPVGDFRAALDALAKVSRSRQRHRIIVLAAPGKWATIATLAVQQAEARAYNASVTVVRGDVNAAIQRMRTKLVDAVFAVAPAAVEQRWYAAAGATNTPWVITARDVVGLPQFSSPVAVEVPWSYTTGLATPVFGPAFSSAFANMYSRQPSMYAAAGETLGLVLESSIQAARSTDPHRLLAARGQLHSTTSLLGPLVFEAGEQAPAVSFPYLVLVGAGSPQTIWPPPREHLKLFRLSVPAGTTAPQQATSANTTTTTTASKTGLP